MTALVLINQPYHRNILVSRLKQMHTPVLICHSVAEAKAHSAQSDMLFVCTQATGLIKEIRHGQSLASPFTGISLLNLDGGHYPDLGVSDEFHAPFSLQDLDAQYRSLRYPSLDFISIPDIYIGPERRRRKQQRLVERRIAPHRYEQRFKPINDETGTTWQQIPNRSFLAALLPLHQEFRSGNKASATPKLKKILADYGYSPEIIKRITGLSSHA